MRTLKRTLPIAIACALMTSQANALIVPVVDPKQAAIEVQSMISDLIMRARAMSIKTAAMDLYSQLKGMELDGFNNGAANAVVRINKAYEDIFNLEQVKNSAPSTSACGMMTYSISMQEALCSENGILSSIGEQLGIDGSGSSLDIYNKAKTIANKVVNVDLKADSTSAGATGKSRQADLSETQKKQKENLEKTIAAVDKMNAWEAEGKLAQAVDPALLLQTESTPLVYTDEELSMAVTHARLLYPPFVRKETEDPIEEREVANDMHKQLALETPATVIAKHIGLRVKPDNGMPSKIAALTLPVQLMFDESGELDPSGESWSQRMLTSKSGNTSLDKKESLLLAGIELQQSIENYKSTLTKEKLLQEMLLKRLRAEDP